MLDYARLHSTRHTQLIDKIEHVTRGLLSSDAFRGAFRANPSPCSKPRFVRNEARNTRFELNPRIEPRIEARIG
jgi:hypothetical protein